MGACHPLLSPSAHLCLSPPVPFLALRLSHLCTSPRLKVLRATYSKTWERIPQLLESNPGCVAALSSAEFHDELLQLRVSVYPPGEQTALPNPAHILRPVAQQHTGWKLLCFHQPQQRRMQPCACREPSRSPPAYLACHKEEQRCLLLFGFVLGNDFFSYGLNQLFRCLRLSVIL